jgi:hypothetical protein
VKRRILEASLTCLKRRILEARLTSCEKEETGGKP